MLGANAGVSVTWRSTLALLVALVFGFGHMRLAEAAPWAKVTVKTPGELLLGKVQNADVTVAVATDTPLLEVSVRSEGKGLSLRSKRKWSFKDLKAGAKTHFKIPYLLTRGFKKGTVEIEIFTVAGRFGPNRVPAQKQIATVTLSR